MWAIANQSQIFWLHRLVQTVAVTYWTSSGHLNAIKFVWTCLLWGSSCPWNKGRKDQLFELSIISLPQSKQPSELFLGIVSFDNICGRCFKLDIAVNYEVCSSWLCLLRLIIAPGATEKVNMFLSECDDTEQFGIGKFSQFFLALILKEKSQEWTRVFLIY